MLRQSIYAANDNKSQKFIKAINTELIERILSNSSVKIKILAYHAFVGNVTEVCSNFINTRNQRIFSVKMISKSRVLLYIMGCSEHDLDYHSKNSKNMQLMRISYYSCYFQRKFVSYKNKRLVSFLSVMHKYVTYTLSIYEHTFLPES